MLDHRITSSVAGARSARGHATDAAPGFDDDTDLLRHALGAPDLPASLLRPLADASRLVRCEAGPLQLSSPRRPEPSWWLVRRGEVAVGRRQPNGHFHTARRLHAGDWLDVAGAVTPPGTWIEDAVFHGAGELLAVPLSALHAACAGHPDFARAFGEVLARRVRDRCGKPATPRGDAAAPARPAS